MRPLVSVTELLKQRKQKKDEEEAAQKQETVQQKEEVVEEVPVIEVAPTFTGNYFSETKQEEEKEKCEEPVKVNPVNSKKWG